VTASNGLTLALGNGTAQLNDSFTVDVFASVGGVVDTTSAFNGTGNSDPNFDPGVSVGAGSFEVNGVTIDVKANDSIDKVLGKINSSAAGVTALFDAATERLVLTQETPGSAATITVGNDTSGFLAATKLDLATVVAGTDDERTLAIGDVAAFAGISSGTFSINGVQLTVDVLNDSLNDLIARIDASGAGADAAFDAATGRFSLTATTTAALTLSDGTSGLFTGLDVLATTYQPERDESPAGIAFRDGAKVRSRLDEFGEALDDLLRATLGEEVEPAVTAVRDRLREAFVGAFDGDVDDEVFSSAGIRFDFDRDASRAFDLQRPSLRLSMERDASGVFTLLAGGRKGLVARLDDAFRDLDRTLRDFATEDTGSLVDRSA
ncbi:MAG: hypothetical protein KAI24_00225, partial [Planctomycetes bacterium]|nr:hypothetical protein [Planctomycetota bacterium]